jgi:hypothetical protein
MQPTKRRAQSRRMFRRFFDTSHQRKKPPHAATLLVDANPRQFLAPTCQVVASACEFLLRLQQF